MNVVHFITRLIIGGAQENTLLTVEDQHRDYGDQVALVCGPGKGPEGTLLERAERGGFGLYVVPELDRAIRPWSDWKGYCRLLSVLKTLKPDIVHTHSSKAGILGRAAAAQLGIPAVHTIHGASFHYGQRALLQRIYIAAEKWAARRCDRFISVCDAMTDQYVAAGIAVRDKFVTIYSGMEVEPFLNPPRSRDDVRREFGFASDHVVVGKVARLFHLKGHEYVIQAASQIVAAVPAVRFLFVGDGVLKQQYEQQIAAAGLQDHFVFAGLVPPQRIPELIAATDLVVHTSVWEGLARVLPQSLISGRPVVSFDVDGAREVVQSGETGFLIPPRSTSELADAVIRLAKDGELRQRMGQTGRERFTEQFRHETMTRRIRDVYHQVLEQKSTP